MPLDAIEGTPQGAVISPLLANVYLHYVYDVWVNAWRKRHASGHMIVVRYADDTVVGFQDRQEALMFLTDLKARLAKFALELHGDAERPLFAIALGIRAYNGSSSSSARP